MIAADSLKALCGQQVIVTRKMDGENTTLARRYVHARSTNSKNHRSRDWVKQLWSRISEDIPENWRVCGENLYARHAIAYDDLESYFLGFSVWDDANNALCWSDTLDCFDLLGIIPVPVLYEGVFNQHVIQSLWKEGDEKVHEGYVVRVADQFSYLDFQSKVAKYVRKGHVQSGAHWLYGHVQPEQNKLRVR